MVSQGRIPLGLCCSDPSEGQAIRAKGPFIFISTKPLMFSITSRKNKMAAAATTTKHTMKIYAANNHRLKKGNSDKWDVPELQVIKHEMSLKPLLCH